MKINSRLLISLFVAIFITSVCSLKSKNTFETFMQMKSKAMLEIEARFRNNVKTSVNTLTNPLRLFKISQEHQIFTRLKFYYNDGNSASKNELNMFNYKALDITSESITVYKLDQNKKEVTQKDVNSSDYLMTFKMQNIDLACNSFMYVCSYAELMREYQFKLKGVDFTLPSDIEKSMSSVIAKEQCMLITIGAFQSVSRVAWICADTKEDFIFYQSYISEKVAENEDDTYSGQILMINEESKDASCTEGLQSGVLNVNKDKIVFSNHKTEIEKEYKKYLTISFDDINGYSNSLYGKEILPWKLDPSKKPSEFRCFKIVAKISEKETNIYFCIFHERSDWERKKQLKNSQALYVNDIWVSTINKKILLYKLRKSQDKLHRVVSKLECNSHVMEPVKLDYRNNYLMVKHKIKLLIALKKIDAAQGVSMLKVYKKKEANLSCSQSDLCVETLNVCEKKGLLSLKFKGYAVAYSLQNPYISLVPQLGISVREYPRNSIGLEMVKTAETLLGIKPSQGNVVVDNVAFKADKMLGSTLSLKRAGNTFEKLFFESLKPEDKITNIEEAFIKVMRAKSIEEMMLMRHIAILTVCSVNDPFLELFGYIRTRSFLK